MVKTGIIGATGYTGLELIKLLTRHPQAEIKFAVSQSNAGRSLIEIYPAAPDLPLLAQDQISLEAAEVVFLCLPHAAAAVTAVAALNAGCRVIDLSADFRIKDVSVYEQWYGVTHAAPHLLDTAVYGLTEFARAALPPAQLVANPGCYPTSILLALQPLLAAGITVSGAIIADSKSGVTGAGRKPKQHTHFVEVADNFTPYNIGRNHRHLPEMEQMLAQWSNSPPPLIFSPHLLPVPRGILSTIYVPLNDKANEADLRSLYLTTYADEPFIKVLPAGNFASLAHVVLTNRCVISLTVAGNTLILTSAIDNLLKGAAGQAVQNMNVMYGFDETIGLVP